MVFEERCDRNDSASDGTTIERREEVRLMLPDPLVVPSISPLNNRKFFSESRFVEGGSSCSLVSATESFGKISSGGSEGENSRGCLEGRMSLGSSALASTSESCKRFRLMPAS